MQSLAIILLFLAAASDQAPQPLTLERAIELAQQNNEGPQTARERLAAAEARLARARAAFFPQLTVSGAYTRRLYAVSRDVAGQPVLNALGATASASVPLLDARSFPLSASAAREREAARYDALDALRLVSFTAADAFVSALSAEQVRAAAQSRLDLAQQSLHEAQARFEAKLAGSNDVTKAQLEAASAARELERAQGGVESAYLALAYVIAQDVRPPLAPPQALLESAATAPPQASAAWIAEALSRRFDLQARRERLFSLRDLALEPRMRFLPTLGLLGQYSLANEAGASGRVANGFASLTLNWTLFDGGVRYADARERDALANAAALDLRAQERRVGTDLDTAQANVAAEQAALRQAQAAAAAAQKNAEEITILYRQGLSSALEVADAGARRFDAEVALVREQYGLALALLDLRASLGLDALGRDVKK